jgi:hypothetical protein
VRAPADGPRAVLQATAFLLRGNSYSYQSRDYVEILADSAENRCGLVACVWAVLVDVLHDSDGRNNLRDNLR